MHVEKYTKKGLGNLFAHYERKNYENRDFSNKEIDKSKTELNYNLAPEHKEGQYKFTKNRCEELKVLNRENVNWACDWCITAPSEIKDDEEKCKAFFKSAYDFLENRYGKENVISAYVHKDETTEHMHFAFIPVSKTEKMEFDTETGELQNKIIEKVSSKEVINKKELSVIHKELQKHLDNELDFKVSVMTGQTATHGNQSIKELKERDRLKEQNERLEQAQKVMLQNVKKLTEYTEKLKQEEQAIKEKVQNLFESSDVGISDLQRRVEILDNKFYNIDRTFKGFESVSNQNKTITLKLDNNQAKQKDQDEELDFV